MTDIEKQFIELTAERAAERAVEKYSAEAKEGVRLAIELHQAQCSANKYKGVKHFASAITGGGIVVFLRFFFDWLLKK